MNRALLLSVRPRFARALLAGTKTVEIRRRFPEVPPSMAVAIYSTSPQKAILGTMRARKLVRSNAEDIWRDYGAVMGLEQSELNQYLHGARECSVLELDRPILWPRPVNLDTLRRLLSVEPAQSFRYLTGRQLVRLEELARSGIEERSPLRLEEIPAIA